MEKKKLLRRTRKVEQKEHHLCSSSAPPARGNKQIKSRDTIKERWIAIFPSSHRLQGKERKQADRQRDEEDKKKQPLLAVSQLH